MKKIKWKTKFQCWSKQNALIFPITQNGNNLGLILRFTGHPNFIHRSGPTRFCKMFHPTGSESIHGDQIPHRSTIQPTIFCHMGFSENSSKIQWSTIIFPISWSRAVQAPAKATPLHWQTQGGHAAHILRKSLHGIDGWFMDDLPIEKWWYHALTYRLWPKKTGSFPGKTMINDGCSISLLQFCYCVLVMVKNPRKASNFRRPVLANCDCRGHHAVNQVVRQHQINVT